jgi:hypothetical protein
MIEINRATPQELRGEKTRLSAEEKEDMSAGGTLREGHGAQFKVLNFMLTIGEDTAAYMPSEGTPSAVYSKSSLR